MPNVTDFEVGDIIMSALPEDKFVAQHGGLPPVGQMPWWVLCDGRDVTNSTYARIVGSNNVPNLIGRYPRGADVAGANGIPTPGVGGYMPDAFGSHSHILIDGTGPGTWGIQNDGQGGGNNQVLRTGYGGNVGTNAQGQNETRPRTTIVNFFIRIN